ncbi:MAG: type III pantothenate kinase [Lentisphaeria bacterium]|nr:type III pantothenate kinase [Lentisphaeria bacterium]
MVELLDIGNSFTRIAEWDGTGIRGLRRVATADFFGTGTRLPQVAACVCPEVRDRLRGREVFFISALEQRSRVDFSAVDGSTLGADRVANAVALAALFPLPGAVIDCGTALTLEVVDEKFRFRGGAIAPGRRLMRRVLHAGTAQLPETPLAKRLPEIPGRNTAEAIDFGVDRGMVGMIREFLAQVNRTMPLRSVVLTGGDAAYFAGEFPQATPADETFTLTGIRIAGGY